MANLVKVPPSLIRLDEPIPYSIYDDKGTLLLMAGFTIQKQSHLDFLLEKGFYYDRRTNPLRPKVRPLIKLEEHDSFDMLDQLKLRLTRLLHNLSRRRGGEYFVAQVEDIALTLMGACAHSNNPALACLHLDFHSSYGIVHHLKTAVLCELIGKKLGIGDAARKTLVQAALTHDLGLIDIQDILDRQTQPMTAQQVERIRSHPADSCRLLEQNGVRDPTWLDTVLHHHERIDGSGYPNQLAEDAIKLPARVLAVADVYSAMIRARPHRKAWRSQDAMRTIMLEEDTKIDWRIVQAMIKAVGMFPPGAIVKLVTGKIGVVKEPTQHIACPIVYSFMRPDGTPMLTPIYRDTSDSQHSVCDIVLFLEYRRYIPLIRGLWRRAPLVPVAVAVGR